MEYDIHRLFCTCLLCMSPCVWGVGWGDVIYVQIMLYYRPLLAQSGRFFPENYRTQFLALTYWHSDFDSNQRAETNSNTPLDWPSVGVNPTPSSLRYSLHSLCSSTHVKPNNDGWWRVKRPVNAVGRKVSPFAIKSGKVCKRFPHTSYGEHEIGVSGEILAHITE